MLPFYIVIFLNIIVSVSTECFSCISNPNWAYYQEKIPGLLLLNSTQQPPLAPLACTFEPMRVYADNQAVACKGYCMKWGSATILPDGNIEVAVLRGCVDRLLDKNRVSLPEQNKCYQSPHDYNHKVGVEYRSTCYCKGFMCNHSPSTNYGIFSLLGMFWTFSLL